MKTFMLVMMDDDDDDDGNGVNTFHTATLSDGAVARRRRRCEDGARPPDSFHHG